MHKDTNTATQAWLATVGDIFKHGKIVAPRGLETREVLQHTMAVNMRHPVVLTPERKLSEKFLGGEAYWILTGDNRVETIAPFNKNIAKYSDDGETFFGAYGPKIHEQLDYVVGKLIEDRDTRQAGLNIWRENPPPTKDVPCTVSMFFNVRGTSLNAHVFMRSSDVWLGVPYDVFNFSMVAHLICCRLNAHAELNDPDFSEYLTPGALYLTAASRHLYRQHYEQASECWVNGERSLKSSPTPFVAYTSERSLLTLLDAVRHENGEAMWWRVEDA